MKTLPYYVTINITNFDMGMYVTLSDVAELVGCNRRTIARLSKRTTVGDYIIVPLTPVRKKRVKKY